MGVLPDSLPIQWQKSTTLQRLPDTSMCIKIIYISVQGKSIGNIQNYEVREGVLTSPLHLCDPPRSLYKEVWFLKGFYLISFELAKIQT
jgi:hypothetical protein